MIKRLYELRNSTISFLQSDNDKLNLVTKFLNNEFNQSLAYMVDIVEMINIINVKLHGQDSNLVYLFDQINAFSIKINNFISSVKVNNYKEFPTLNGNFNNITIKKVILDHLKRLQQNIKTYFPDTLASLSTFLMNPFEYDSQLIGDSTLRNECIELITYTRLKSYHIKHIYIYI